MKDTIFIKHIAEHLPLDADVICKICGKTADAIIKEELSKAQIVQLSPLARVRQEVEKKLTCTQDISDFECVSFYRKGVAECLAIIDKELEG